MDFDWKLNYFKRKIKVDQVEHELSAQSESVRGLRTFFIEICQKLTFLHPKQRDRDGLIIRLQYHSPLSAERRSCDTWLLRINSIVSFLFVLQFTYAGMVLLYRDILLEVGSLSTIEEAHIFHDCAMRNETFRENELAYSLILLLDWIDGKVLGNPAKQMSAIGEFGLLSISTLYASLYLLVFFTWRYKNDLHALSFLMNPIGSRARIRREIKNVLRLVNHQAAYFSANIADLNVGRCKPHSNEQGSLCQLDFSRSSARNPEFSEALAGQDIDWLLDETVYSAETHSRILGSLDFMLNNFVYPTTTESSLGFPIGLLLIELYLDAELRLSQLDCKRWSQDSVYLKLRSSPLDSLDRLDSASYERHDGTWINIFKLMLTIEFSQITLPQMALFIGTIWLVFVSFIWESFYYASYYVEWQMSAIWIEKLDKQLDLCIQMLKIFQHERFRRCDESWEDLFTFERQRQRQLDHATTSAYISFELFRRHQRNLQEINSHVASYTMLATGSLVYLCSIICQSVTSKLSPFLVLVALSFVALADFFLIYSTRMTDKMHQIFRKISSFVAAACSCGICMRHPIDLWRRQLSDEAEIERLFAPTAFGYPITKESVLSLNAYALGATIFVFKAFLPVQGQ